MTIKKLPLLLTFAIFVAVLMFASDASAQGIKVGGYKDLVKTDAGARAAAVFAVDAIAKKTKGTVELNSVLAAASQLVAGTNYRLCLKVTMSGAEDEPDVITTLTVFVNRDLKKKYTLGVWKEEVCGDDDDEM